MNFAVFMLVLFGLQGICLWIGSRSSGTMKTQDDYYLAGKSVKFFPLMMTFVATVVGGGVILGSSEEAYNYGWPVLCFPLGSALGLLALGMGVGRKLAELPVSTIAQIFELSYKSPFLRKIASLLSMLTLFLIFVAQLVGSSKFLVSVGLTSPVLFIGFWLIVIIYTALGGMKGLVNTDIIQALFFIVIFLLCFALVAYGNQQTTLDIFQMGWSSEGFAFDGSKLIGWLLMPLLFMMIEQDMAQRCFAADAPKTVSKASLAACVCTIMISFVPVFLGMMAKSMGIVIPAGASVLMVTIMQTCGPLFSALVAGAIIVAIISTANSLINAIGSNLAQDFDLFSKTNVRASQIMSSLIAFSGLFCCFWFDNIVNLIILSYELSVSSLFVPIAFALYRKEGNVWSAALAMACGAICFIACKIYPPTYVPKELLSLILSLAGFGAGEFIVAYTKRDMDILSRT